MKKIIEHEDLLHKEKTMYTVNELILLVIASTLFGIAIGFFIGQDKMINGTLYDKNIIDYRPDKYLTDFISVYDTVNKGYYKSTDSQKLIDGAIDGMLTSLDDPYTGFLSEKQTKTFDTMLEGNYLGIGIAMETTQDGSVTIKSVFADTPASKAGLKVGDKIIKINADAITNKNATEVASLMRNDKVKELLIMVNRDGQEVSFNVKKEKIQIPSVTNKIIETEKSKIGYIGINLFSTNTPEQVKTALTGLEKKEVKSLVIDVRDNSGGYLKSLDSIMSLFLTKKDIIYQVTTAEKHTKAYAKGKERKKIPVYVLINGNSASASEILAAAFKETYGATLIGETTYGKGTVQKAAYLKTGGMYKFTTQNWLTPSGESITGKGVKPDFEVLLNEAYYTNPSVELDNQLQKAIELANK